MSFRKLTLQKIVARFHSNHPTPNVNPRLLKNSGELTDLVQQELGKEKDSESGSFRERFLALPPGKEREDLVFEEVTQRGVSKSDLVPVTVRGPADTQITYYVMPDFITIDGIRVPMAGKTAQRIADHLGMNLPTSKMAEQIWEAADVKIRPTPLSASGYQGRDKYYSPEEVVRGRISASEAAEAYSQKIQEMLEEKGGGRLVAGHMKSLIAPEGDPKKLGLYGWFDPETGEPLEPSIQTGHDTSVHSEYGAGTRLVGNQVTITLPSGRKITSSLEEVLEHPDFHRAVSSIKGKKRYS